MPEHLIASARKHLNEKRAVAIVVRHAERHPVDDLARHEEVLLTERGHEHAREAGTRVRMTFAAHAVRVAHSPVTRCKETALGIATGAGASCRVVGPEEGLGSPFVVDRQRAFEYVVKTGPRFIRHWFDGKIPADVFMPRRQAARAQLDAIERHLEPESLAICVTHDWNIALLKEDLLALTPERGWPNFLDGIVVARDKAGTLVEHDGRIGRT
jgi:broad specificity phosphatase PhoE